ncbi:hypothetical protein MVEN_02063500 [Mycena venus]|uniref:FUN14-domain-containing protein n=1 Tax=Mycena venus TaxID=2733690 RepID=A0A8H6XC69_9AGAR|nr:hypothetical protein MVEN_02063500 [Mycena venus]
MLYLSAARANFCSRSVLSFQHYPFTPILFPKFFVGARKMADLPFNAKGRDQLRLRRQQLPPPLTPDAELPPPPGSSVNVYELTFGTVAGICAGVFIKKGAKAVAFFLGGVFVLLQYFGSFGVLKVDWEGMGSRFQRVFYTTDPKTGNKATPTIYSLWRWMVDFLTADFQPRASFIAGLALGLRIG